ncbi:MAG TPA: hypothetical protein VE645_00220, partial [Pseudonocardiaceae bacterium]|nr:hypothetical protein [Pseudonocardiaceae bacterium]
MTKLRVSRGIDHHRAAPLMPPRWLRVVPPLWWALGGWLTGSPAGYGLTGSVAGGLNPGFGFGLGQAYSGRSRRWHCPLGDIGGAT